MAATICTAGLVALSLAWAAKEPASGPAGAGSTSQSQPGANVIAISSPAFKDGQPIPQKQVYEKGAVNSPELSWKNPPAGVKEFALICDDSDAPFPDKPRKEGPWVHWVIYKIPAAATGLKEAIAKEEKLSEPTGALQGRNDFNEIGYSGPMPPQGSPPHRYIFTLFALDAQLDLKPGLTKAELLEAIKGHVIAQGTLTGTFKR